MAHRRIVALVAAVVMSGAAVGVAAHPQGAAPAGANPGCPGWGSGMMGGSGMGPGMMGGYGMGPGMMGDYGMGPGMMGGAWAGRPAGKLDLSVKDVTDFVQNWIARTGNAGLKVGRVAQAGDTITAEVVTTPHGDLVHRWTFDRNTGQMQPAG